MDSSRSRAGEQRRGKRFRVFLPAEFALRRFAQANLGPILGKKGQATVTDLSPLGLAMLTTLLLPVGMEITLSFSLPGGAAVHTPGRVVWAKPEQSRYAHGVTFTDITPPDQAAVGAYIARRAALERKITAYLAQHYSAPLF